MLRFYTCLLWLYPRQFRQDFTVEMQTVFGDALGAACQDGWWIVLKLCGREARQLPGVLAREYQQLFSLRKGTDMIKRLQTSTLSGEVEPGNDRLPASNWSEVLLAVLPFGLILLLNVIPMLLVQLGLLAWSTPAMKALNTILIVLASGTLLAIFVLAWRRKWPIWSATWYLIFIAALAPLFGVLFTWLYQRHPDVILSQNLFIYFLGPLILAVLLYSAMRRDPRRGLLAALPLFYALWHTDMEFVSNSIEIAIEIPSLVLFCLTAAYLLQSGSWRSGLYATLATNLAVGALYSYAGIYHGGMLPSSADGPNLTEVVRALIPMYLAMGAILLGPLFARKIRRYGRTAGLGGRVGYHLALAGLLLVILAYLAGLMMGTEPSGITRTNRTLLVAAILLGLGIYLLSLVYLFRGSLFSRQPASRLLLAFLPLAIPLTFVLPFITWTRPISDLYGTPLLWALPHALSLSVGVAWLALSVWVVAQETGAAAPGAPVGDAYEMAG